ncbi:beta-N-acetylhexosaminidase [Cardiobacteriaceae bacterium TAE3-ERU3]|nr:beta-N-acetylhexosaminidase [Cardiobacteriaceae bacterium TAE3-ERU3]
MSIIIGIESTKLSTEDKRRLEHPACSGVILFSRNYSDSKQLRSLCAEIKHIDSEKLICVDHEGGRVQRFRTDSTALPAPYSLGLLFKTHPLRALALSKDIGIVMAYELGQYGIDFSFAPILDLYDEVSSVIAERAFSDCPAVVSTLASALRTGLRTGGLAAVGKHYPGHGRVQGDSHHVLPHDTRPVEAREADLYPFAAQIKDGIEGIMTAHIVYPETNGIPGGFSPLIIDNLRQLGFNGAIFSDDLDMAGAQVFKDAAAQVQAALDAGADFTLICNNFAAMDQALQSNPKPRDPQAFVQRKKTMLRKQFDAQAFEHAYQHAKARLEQYRESI